LRIEDCNRDAVSPQAQVAQTHPAAQKRRSETALSSSALGNFQGKQAVEKLVLQHRSSNPEGKISMNSSIGRFTVRHFPRGFEFFNGR
jgi:hypothetical protein